MELLHQLRASVCPKEMNGKDEFSSFLIFLSFLFKIGKFFLQIN